MLVWINGPFGGGKTATACELHRRLPGSAVCDPEPVGFGMRRMLPVPLRGNFQDLPAWRHSVAELLRLTLTAYAGPVIVPMTLVNRGCFQEIIGSLRDDGFAVGVFRGGQAAPQGTVGTGYDVIILDRDLLTPHSDRVCRELVRGGSPGRILTPTPATGVGNPP